MPDEQTQPLQADVAKTQPEAGVPVTPSWLEIADTFHGAFFSDTVDGLFDAEDDFYGEDEEGVAGRNESFLGLHLGFLKVQAAGDAHDQQEEMLALFAKQTVNIER